MSSMNTEGPERRQVIVTPKSMVTVGGVSLSVMFLGGAIWWAATIQQQLNQVIKQLETTHVVMEKIADQETRMRIIEARLTSAKIP